MTYALTTAVDVRSYSRNVGETSCERVTVIPGASSAASSATRFSWTGFR